MPNGAPPTQALRLGKALSRWAGNLPLPVRFVERWACGCVRDLQLVARALTARTRVARRNDRCGFPTFVARARLPANRGGGSAKRCSKFRQPHGKLRF